MPMREETAWLQNGEKRECIRVLGVDPAAAGPTGYAIVESEGRLCRSLHYGALKISSSRRKAGDGAALQDVHELLCHLIEQYLPHVVAVESVFYALNVKTALRLAEVRGVVLLAAAQHGLEVHSYAPREVKAAIAGYGHADKRQMQIMVRAILSMAVTPEPSDAADALAVALCHLQMAQARRRFGLPGQKGIAVPRRLGLDTGAAIADGAALGGQASAPGLASSVRGARATRSGLPRIVSAL
jgi:crossover junction endodeoxyribonuclease RuvC